MNRDDILAKFKSLRFCVLWPGNWKDVGFTERPIWINAEGYGYYYDDEPCLFTLIEASPETVKTIKAKAENNNLTVDDIKGTPFCELNISEDEEYWQYHLEDLMYLPNESNGIIFCGDTDDGWAFYATEEELIAAFEKNSSEYNFGQKWEDLDDALLEEWFVRIFSSDQPFELPMTLDITSR